MDDLSAYAFCNGGGAENSLDFFFAMNRGRAKHRSWRRLGGAEFVENHLLGGRADNPLKRIRLMGNRVAQRPGTWQRIVLV
jgi:hypothetical protein